MIKNRVGELCELISYVVLVVGLGLTIISIITYFVSSPNLTENFIQGLIHIITINMPRLFNSFLLFIGIRVLGEFLNILERIEFHLSGEKDSE